MGGWNSYGQFLQKLWVFKSTICEEKSWNISRVCLSKKEKNYLKVQSCKSFNNKYMIASIQITKFLHS